MLTLAAVCAGAVALPAGVAPAASTRVPACFGAAARDAAHPCKNPALYFSVTPRPDDALLQPSSPCTILPTKAPPSRVCAFGVSKQRAVATIGLLGDSHAPAWRAAVDHLARAQRWRGLTVRRSSCPFSFAQHYVEKAAADACFDWVRASIRFFAHHPEIKTVFIVNSAAYRWKPVRGLDPHAAAVEGYRSALSSLPASVKRIVILRDNPEAAGTTAACVERARSRGWRPDTRCAMPRATALEPDELADAAASMGSDRLRTIDLTRFFCDDALCYPVVGGALVYKDTSHITMTYSATLGPYLLADYRALGLPPTT
ncbi:O-antigen acetylase [Paraconexibacter sp. AEG42_29]|uniref:O-antigen acetylase n=1 Tax=Paraconexibacter sp. AEG42_29 TaxID=2997339 RepID=A0AAU7AWZ2_9ACTN